MANPAAILNVLVTADTRKAQAGLAGLNKQLGQSDSAARRVGGQFAKFGKVAAVGVAGGLAYAVKKAADFEQQMDSLGAVANASGKQMEQLRQQAMKAGADTKFSALEAAQAQTELAKGGLSVAKIMKGGLKSALALAAAGEMDLAEAAGATVNAMKLFGLRGKDAMRVADGFATAANKTTADVADFAMALKMGGSAAKAAGLTFAETTSVLEALAEMGIRNSDAGTSMKAMLTQLAAPTAKQKDLTKALNLEFFDQEGKMRSLTDISGMLRDRLGEMGDQQRLATVKTLAGTDGMRALLALYDAGPRKLAEFQKGLEKQGTAAKVAAEKQDNFRGKLENLQGSIETVAISVGSKLLPSLTDAAEQITNLLNDKSLSNDEKLRKFADMFGHWVSVGFEKAIEAAAAAGPKLAAALGRGFLRFWSDANPIAKVFGTAAIIRLVGGRGALTAAGAAIGRFLGIGVAAGAATGAVGAGGGAAAGGLAGGILSKLKAGAGRAGLVGAGILAADVIIDTASNQMDRRSDDLFKALDAKGEKPITSFLSGLGATPIAAVTDQLESGERGAKGFATELKNIVALNQHISPEHARALREEMDSLGDFSSKARKQFEGLIEDGVKRAQKLRLIQGNIRTLRGEWKNNVEEMRKLTERNMQAIENKLGLHSKQGVDALRDNFNSAVRGIASSFRDGKGITNRGGREIARLLDSYSEKGKQALSKNYEDIVGVVRTTMTRSGNITKQGLSLIEGLYSRALEAAGLNPKEAMTHARVMSGRIPEENAQGGHQRGGLVEYATGGVMRMTGGSATVPGSGSGDKVHLQAMVEPGERVFVLNRNASKKLGALDRLNSAVPRFQGGGELKQALGPYDIPPIQYDPNHAGGNSHVHIAMATIAAAKALAGRIGPMGWSASEAPWAGGLSVAHQDPGHYTGSSFDANTAADETRAEVSALARVLGGAGGALGSALMAKFKPIARVLIEGTDSPLRSIVQATVDNMRTAANSQLKSAITMSGFSGGGGAGANKSLGHEMMLRYWGEDQWPALLELWTRESGWSTTADNPKSAAYGIPQANPGSKMASAGADWQTNAATQIKWGLNYIKSVYGSPSGALAHSDATGWYQSGGLVQALATGGDVTSGLAGSYYPNIGGPFGRVLRTARGVRPRRTRKVISRFLDRMRELGLPPELTDAIKNLDLTERTAGEVAARAGQLTDSQAIQDALDTEAERRAAKGQAFPSKDQQAIVDRMLGRVYGRTEIEWLQAQLDALFKLRNRLVEADPIIVGKRDGVAKLLGRGQHRVGVLNKRIKRDTARRDGLQEFIRRTERNLDAERSKPKGKRNERWIDSAEEALKGARAEVEGLNVRKIRPDIRERGALKNRILPAFQGKIGALSTLRGDTLSHLEEVQGLGAPAEILKDLPALGILGGTLGDVQFNLADLLGHPPRASDVDAGEDRIGSERVGLLEGLLRDANLRTAVSQLQYGVLKDFPYMGAFAKGGVALVGERGPELAHMPSGTRVHSASDTQALMQPEVNVQLNFAPGMEWLERFVDVRVETASRKQVRSGATPLPGRGGGIHAR